MGGIVWRLAQQSLPDSVVLCGPSQDAPDGCCEVVSYGGEMFCDNTLPDITLDFICGVYKIQKQPGKHFHLRTNICSNISKQDNLLKNLGGQNTISGYQVATIMDSGPMSVKVGFWNGSRISMLAKPLP